MVDNFHSAVIFTDNNLIAYVILRVIMSSFYLFLSRREALVYVDYIGTMVALNGRD